MAIRNHPFFDDIDWQKLVDLELEAPYLPEINTADPEQAQNQEDQMNV